jgi:hypothetical protein
MKLVYLPLDSRPCNALFPIQLSALRGVIPLAPPREAMDFFRTPAPSGPTLDWLARETQDADALVLAVDHLCFGSLLASREDDVTEQEAMNRLEQVAMWKASNPWLRIFAYSVIMRSAISTLKAQDVAYHRAVTAYYQATHRAQLDPSTENQAVLDLTQKAVPKPILEKYTRVRRRNHQVNLSCVRLAALGVFDRLMLLQEDSQPLGIHKMEQAVLMDMIARSERQEHIYLHNGTDEAGCLCCAAAISSHLCFGLRIKPVYLRGGGSFTALYEDRPFEDNLRSHCACAGVTLTSGEDADCLLCIDTPPDGIQTDYMHRSPQEENGLEAAAQVLAEALESGRPVGFLDLLLANGGDGRLLKACAERTDITRLNAYAAWNTASNSLGTILAQLLCSGGKASTANTAFTLERLLDDYGYQGNVRAVLDREVTADGDDPYCLQHPERWEQRLIQLCGSFAREDELLSCWQYSYRCGLLWPRTFETWFEVTGLEGRT